MKRLIPRTPVIATLSALTALAALTTFTNLSAKPMRGAALGTALSACLLADDVKTAENAQKFACCSRDAGICVVCPQPPSASGSCDVINYRMQPIPGAAPMSASSIGNVRQQWQVPPGSTKTPSTATTPVTVAPSKP
jgi:hypothetical protein